MLKKICFITLLNLHLLNASAQLCTNPGQTPVSAILVCSSETFSLITQEYCGQTSVPNPCPVSPVYQNKNPNFFRFACYNAGTLGFTIVPDELTANYSWQLFDITNTNPSDIFTNGNLFRACNWSSEPGETGASIDGLDTIVCSGSLQPLFSKMPNLQTGHTYLLMVVNESGSSGGYQLSLAGGTAVITDPVDPHFSAASVNCDRTKIYLRLNKLVRCITVAPDGSDFSLSGGATIISASPDDCSSEFGTGSITITLNQPLGFGNYSLRMNSGTDGNTLVDICNRSISVTESVNFVSAPQQFSPMDSLFNVACNPRYIELIFTNPVRCSSISPDGSDFKISGPQTVTATPMVTTCNSLGLATIVRLNLSASLTPGDYLITLAAGTDGNTLINECLVPTPAGSILPFKVEMGVSAGFTQSGNSSCSQNTVAFFHDGANSVNSWNWDFGNGSNSNLPSPVINFTKGTYRVRLTVTNGICTDTSSQTVTISDGFNAAFDAPLTVCAGDLLSLKDNSSGNIDTWNWNFGNGTTSNQQTPPPFRYAETGSDNLFTIRLVVSNSALGCNDTVSHVVHKLKNCLIAVPSAFTPNGDGKNDFLYPLNAVKAENLEFKVYNRVGHLAFLTKDWTKKWDGRINGVLQNTGIYAWILSYTHRDTREKIFLKGTSLLLR